MTDPRFSTFSKHTSLIFAKRPKARRPDLLVSSLLAGCSCLSVSIRWEEGRYDIQANVTLQIEIGVIDLPKSILS